MASAGIKGREIVIAITFIATMVVIIDYFTTIPLYATTWYEWATVLMAFTMGLAVIGVYRLHLTYIKRREPGQWGLSIYTIALLTLTIILGLMGMAATLDPMSNPIYSFIITNITAPLDATQYGMTGFFIMSALYRAFRARTKEASILVICTILLLLFNSTLAVATVPAFGDIGAWLLANPGTGAARGMLIASGAGMVGMTLRLITGKERGYAAE